MIRVLMVDDEQKIARAFARALRRHGILVESYDKIGDFLAAVRTGDHDVILIDWNLRICEGTDLCIQLRREGETRPIALVSGKLEIDHARDLAQRCGADDFIPKPIATEDLVDQIKNLAALPRRLRGCGKYLEVSASAAGFELLPDGWVVVDEHRIRLRKKEHALLRYLTERFKLDVTYLELLEHVFGLVRAKTAEGKKKQDHLVRVHINRLRKQLRGAVVIETVAGGYRIGPSSKASKEP